MSIFEHLKRKRRLVNRTARWALNNGMHGEWCIGNANPEEAWDYVTKRLKVEGIVDRNGMDWLEFDIVEYWTN